MLAYILAIAVGFGSLALYIAAFFFPEVHRKDDFLWSGVGLLYALVLWVCAGRITGGVLLGQMAGVSLLLWFGWETLKLRRVVAHPELRSEIESFSLSVWLQNRLAQLTKGKPQPVAPARMEQPTDTTIPEPLVERQTEEVIEVITDTNIAERETVTEQPIDTEEAVNEEIEVAAPTVETAQREVKREQNLLQKLLGGITSSFGKQKLSKGETSPITEEETISETTVETLPLNEEETISEYEEKDTKPLPTEITVEMGTVTIIQDDTVIQEQETAAAEVVSDGSPAMKEEEKKENEAEGETETSGRIIEPKDN
ncbi:MAG: Ycf66 family protein [Gomphosphaeria aponina SAG 52.96 = DSM 107014]|uniref:Ycf66 family protein n=1 Tax=Gomphosphaeria aponina SAG 52.96 = DSM 107014 TaxID=1521640 RepID=A0A941JV88_9CHRO|nr:Ycf66 family protein [Gomphosphaeria aponina SAG 52.96 = DSM 107014]